MLSMRIHELGGEPVADDIDFPEPGAGQVRLAVRACGVNFADTLMQKGQYQERPDLPFAPGMEVAGIVDTVGPGVDTADLRPGMRVAGVCGHGGFAQYVVIDAARCIPLPDSVPDHHAAAMPIVYGTAHLALGHRARLREGERLLVLGAAGGVGLTGVEMGKLLGAEVIACARGPERLEHARRAGADHLIDSETADLRAAVLGLGGADVIYDPIGGDLFKAAMRAANPEARIIPIGFASGTVPQIPANILLVKNLDIIGVYWGGYLRFNPGVLSRSLQTLFSWYGAGRLRPHVSHRLALAQAGDALRLLRERRATGKIVLETG